MDPDIRVGQWACTKTRPRLRMDPEIRVGHKDQAVEDSKSANCIREIREIIINTCQSDPNPVTVNSSQYIFYKLLHW